MQKTFLVVSQSVSKWFGVILYVILYICSVDSKVAIIENIGMVSVANANGLENI
jgi:hypothetical protein